MINQFDPFNSRMQRGRDNGNNAARTEHTTNDAQGKKMYENKEVIVDKVIDVSYEAPAYPEPGNEY